MADTKKEHYVPRCYLENFVGENQRIKVFDKFKMQKREQRIMEIAMENYFYDIKFDELIQKAEEDEQEKIKSDLQEIVGTDKWEDVLEVLDEKYIEKNYLGEVEGIYSEILKQLIKKSYGGNSWVMQNCYAFSENEKLFMSLFIAIQQIRTKTYRNTINDTITKMYETMAYKHQMKDENALPKEAFKCEVNPNFVKLQHSGMILDEEMAVGIAETLSEHIWVMYVNKSEYPFYTSDNPVAVVPHKKDRYMSYGGLKSESVEILFPISSNLLLGMYEKGTYSHMFTDRTFKVLKNKDQIDYFNCSQVYYSNRCVFSSEDDFELAERMCKEQPALQKYMSHIEVG